MSVHETGDCLESKLGISHWIRWSFALNFLETKWFNQELKMYVITSRQCGYGRKHRISWCLNLPQGNFFISTLAEQGSQIDLTKDKRITSEISYVLKRVFEKIPSPTDEQIQRLSGKYGVSPTKIKVRILQSYQARLRWIQEFTPLSMKGCIH